MAARPSRDRGVPAGFRGGAPPRRRRRQPRRRRASGSRPPACGRRRLKSLPAGPDTDTAGPSPAPSAPGAGRAALGVPTTATRTRSRARAHRHTRTCALTRSPRSERRTRIFEVARAAATAGGEGGAGGASAARGAGRPKRQGPANQPAGNAYGEYASRPSRCVLVGCLVAQLWECRSARGESAALALHWPSRMGTVPCSTHASSKRFKGTICTGAS